MIVTALGSALLELVIALIFLASYYRNKYKPALYFGLGMLSYSIAHFIAAIPLDAVKAAHGYKYELFVTDVNYKIFETLRNVFVGLFMFFALLAASEYVERYKKYITVYALLGLIVFYALRFSCAWFLGTKHIAFHLAQWVYLIPGSLIVAITAYMNYKELGVIGPLLVSASFVIYAVILPLYAMLKGTPHIGTWYALRILSEILLLVGVLMS